MKNKEKYDLRRLHYFIEEGTIGVYYRPKHVEVERIERKYLQPIAEIKRDGRMKSELIGEWLEGAN